MANADILITKEKDKTGVEVSVKLAQQIGGSPVLPFFLRNYADLIDNGHSNPFLFGTNKSKAVYIEVDNEVAGHIVYDILDDAYKTAWIVFSCVEDGFRRRGLYMIMHRHFEQIVKNAGSKRIASHVHVDNKVRYASCEAVGMKPDFYRMEKTIV
jgi:hypothetical protein